MHVVTVPVGLATVLCGGGRVTCFYSVSTRGDRSIVIEVNLLCCGNCGDVTVARLQGGASKTQNGPVVSGEVAVQTECDM